MLARTVLLIVLLFPVGVAAQSLCSDPKFTWGHCPPKTEPSAQHPQADQRGTDERPIAVKRIRTADDEEDAKHQAKEEAAKTNRENELFNATLAIAIATIALAMGTGYLARYTYLIWQDAQETSRNESRAYLGCTGANVKPVEKTTNGMKWRVIVHYHNRGQTPAHDVEDWYDVRLLDIPLKTAKVFASPPRHGDKWAIVPHANASPMKAIEVTDAEFAEMIADPPTKAIFAWGKFRYLDIYRERAVVRFRYRAHPIIGTQDWILLPEPSGNRAKYPEQKKKTPLWRRALLLD